MTTKTYSFAEVWDSIGVATIPYISARSYEGPMDDDVRERFPESVFRSNTPDYNYSYIDITEGGRAFLLLYIAGSAYPECVYRFYLSDRAFGVG